MDLSHFEHIPYFEHHVCKQRIFKASLQLTYKHNLVHEDVCGLVDEMFLSCSFLFTWCSEAYQGYYSREFSPLFTNFPDLL